uniref:N-acetylgalactosaminide beta-1,3-galactosyltransferase n=1 Tax=Rhabditophanes sp. KR3021 TaxID=114890 RepID=A0AC35THU2_9BILA
MLTWKSYKLYLLLSFLGFLLAADEGEDISKDIVLLDNKVHPPISDNGEVFKIVSDKLKNEVKVFCIIITTPKYKETRAIPQIKTFLKRCNNFMYASSVEDKSIRAFKAFPKDHYKFGYAKTRAGLKKAYKKYGDKYDWYLKIDDDSYVILESLRAFLINKNASEPQYHGFRLTFTTNSQKFDYHQGGAYVMSRATVKALVNGGFSHVCRKQPDGYDDREIGECLKKMNISATDARDINNKLIFVPSNPLQFTSSSNVPKVVEFLDKGFMKFEKGASALSDWPISFHYISTPEMFYTLEYLIYRVNVIGQRQKMFETEDANKSNVELAKKILAKIRLNSKKIYKHGPIRKLLNKNS